MESGKGNLNEKKKCLQCGDSKRVVTHYGGASGLAPTFQPCDCVSPQRRMTMKIDENGLIEEGPYEGLYLRPLLDAMKDSSWDFPSAMMTLEFDPKQFYGDEDRSRDNWGFTMHPGEYELDILRKMFPEENWKDFNMSWDT